MAASHSPIAWCAHASRTPYAAIALSMAITIGVWVQARGKFSHPSTALERVVWLNPKSRGYTSPAAPLAEPICIARGPDGSWRVGERAHTSETLYRGVAFATQRFHGLFTRWYIIREYQVHANEGDLTNEQRRAMRRAWWAKSRLGDFEQGGLHREITHRSVLIYDVSKVALAYEIAFIIAMASAARAYWYTAFHWRRDRRRARNACPSCGYPREGLESAAACPECGLSPIASS